MITPKTLIIDPEFRDLIPPLSSDEYENLKESIREHGFRPERGLILTWNDIIIDGHNRYQICQELEEETGEPYLDLDNHVREMSHLGSRRDVLLWMLRNQLGRRNLSDAARISVAMKIGDLIREEAKANLVTSTGGSDPRPLQKFAKAEKDKINTRKKIADYAGVSHETVRKVKQIKEKGDQDLIERVMLGKTKIHTGFMELKAKEQAKAALEDSDPENMPAPETGFIEMRAKELVNSKENLEGQLEKIASSNLPLKQPQIKKLMNSIALITEDVQKLAEFYLLVLQVKADVNDVHTEIPVDNGSIIIYAKSAAEKDMGFDFNVYHGTGLFKFSFSVLDIDAEYERLKSLDINIEFICIPTTYPWGTRSFHFRDLDGNIICFIESM